MTFFKLKWMKLNSFATMVWMCCFPFQNVCADDAQISQQQTITVKQFQSWLTQRRAAQSLEDANATQPKQTPPLTYEQSQATMLRQAPQLKRPTSVETRMAFDSLLEKNMPLTPQQMVLLRQQIDMAQRAAAITPTVPPKPVSSTIMVNLAPGATPPVLRLAPSYVSSMVFVDSSGAPWPIQSFDIGNPKAMNVQWDGKSNIVLLQAIQPYSTGDFVVRLVNLPTPITIELVAGQRVVDYRADIHVPGMGPNAKAMPTGTALPDSANQILLSVLDGTAPPRSQPLTVRGGDGMAWVVGDKMYLRTRMTLLSPGWVGRMTSPDGMQAYELRRTSTILVSRYGQPVEWRIEGY